VYQCNEFAIDPQRLEIRRNGEIRHVEPQVFSLIKYLIENRNRVVSKDEIIKSVWHGRIVSDSTLSSRINAARRALDDDGKTQAMILTVPRRGFRFVAEVTRVAPSIASSPGLALAKTGQFAPIVQPCLAVLPFRYLNADKDRDYLADGLTEDIIDAISRFRGLFVISPTTSIAYKGREMRVQDVGAELAVSYVVEGSVRLAPGRIRVAAELTDVNDSKVIWAEQFDRNLDDIFAVQEEIARQVAASIEPQLSRIEERKSRALSPNQLDAWGLYLRGVALLYTFTEFGLARAEECFNECIRGDPEFAQAHARLAYVHIQRFWYGPHEARADRIAAALECARRAITLDDRDALGPFALGRALALQAQYDQAIVELKRAIRLNPSFAQAYLGLGQALVFAGRSEEGLAHLDTAIRLSPRDPHQWTFYHMKALAFFELKRLEEAEDQAMIAVHEPNATHWPYATLVAILGAKEQPTRAKPIIRQLLDMKPMYSCAYAEEEFVPFWQGRFVEEYISNLRAAGVKEA
jgi:TolB-like protein